MILYIGIVALSISLKSCLAFCLVYESVSNGKCQTNRYLCKESLVASIRVLVIDGSEPVLGPSSWIGLLFGIKKVFVSILHYLVLGAQLVLVTLSAFLGERLIIASTATASIVRIGSSWLLLSGTSVFMVEFEVL